MSHKRTPSGADLTRALQTKITSITPGWDIYFSKDSSGLYTAEALRDPDHHISMSGTDKLALVWRIGQVTLDINQSLPAIAPELDKEHLMHSKVAKSLPGPLKDFLTEEIYRGNVIERSWSNWGQVVLMQRRFPKSARKVEPPLSHSPINDPHYCYEEVSYKGTKFSVAALWG